MKKKYLVMAAFFAFRNSQFFATPQAGVMELGNSFNPVYQPHGVTADLFSVPDSLSQQLELLEIFTTSYPDISFSGKYDSELNDWLITATNSSNGTSQDFYWCHGSMLLPEELANKEKYLPLLYDYPKTLLDPADMTAEEQQALKEYGSSESRKTGPGTPMFFFDWLYQTTTERKAESQMVVTKFLGKPIRIHPRIKQPLANVEKRILETQKTDKATADFVKNISSTEAYYWRIIAGTNRRSFHSLGIAIDIVPYYYGGEAYWSWAKDHRGDSWMLTPLSRRWLPPQGIVEAFEAEGFIWGGKWAIWDNMHFEYHPELLEYNHILD